jgi:acyl-coenzyme A synthetase/AMP-(fatty) acid ligase
VFPSNVIAYYAITAQPALEVGATLISLNFDPYQYIKAFNKYKPTVIALIPRMVEILQGTKGFQELDMSSVRYMIMGSQNVPMDMINMLRDKGVQTVGNWYGSTETPPPVFVAKNGPVFDFIARQGYTVTFDEGECFVNGVATNDVFDIETRTFLKRKTDVSNFNTWKNKP